MNQPKVLLVSPVNIIKEYCINDWLNTIKKLSYPNYDILLVDNSLLDHFSKSIRKKGFDCFHENPKGREAREFMAASLERGRVKFLAGDYDYFFSCFRGKTLIETNIGSKKIREIKVGDFVKTHRNRFKRVVKVFKTTFHQRNLLNWIYTNNSVIKCTPNHPFYIKRNNEYIWEKANNLVISDKLLYPIENKKKYLSFKYIDSIHKIKTNKKIVLNDEIARFLGLYLAEGCPTDSGIRFTFNNNEKEYIDFIEYISIKYFNRKPTKMINWATSLTINIRSFSKLFESWFGSHAHLKKIPDYIFDWPLKTKLSLLKGYFDGDGCYTHKGVISFDTASKQLFIDIEKLLIQCGITDKLNYQIPKPNNIMYKNNIIHSKGCFKGYLSIDCVGKFLDLLNSSIKNNFIEIEITKNLKKRMPSLKDQYVYNLEVEEDKSYIANSCIVHNCECDIFPPKDIIEKLLAHNTDVVGCTYWTDHGYNTHLQLQTIYNLHTDYENHTKDFKVRFLSFEEAQLFMDGQCKHMYGAGIGCCLIKRSVLESISFRINPDEVGFADSFFHKDIWQAGIDFMVDTSIIPKHRNSNWNTVLSDTGHKKLQAQKGDIKLNK